MGTRYFLGHPVFLFIFYLLSEVLGVLVGVSAVRLGVGLISALSGVSTASNFASWLVSKLGTPGSKGITKFRSPVSMTIASRAWATMSLMFDRCLCSN